MEPLGGMDAGFLYAETPRWHMHMGALIVVDPSTAPETFDIERLRTLVSSRLGELGPFGCRLIDVPFGLGQPMWVGDSEIDLDRHIRPVGVPAPGGPKELAALAGDLFAHKLERDRPLWKIWFIEGLEQGKVALLVKAHHALVDGTRGTRLYETLFDLTPDAPFERPGTAPVNKEKAPSLLNMISRTLPWLAGTPLRAARATRELSRAAANMVRFQRSDAWASATLPFQAPRTSINQQITARRGFAFCSVDLSDVKRVKNAFGVTVNDVVLAISAGALRRYLQDRNELPSKPLIAQIPVAVAVDDKESGDDAWGNQVSVIGASLSTDIGDPVERLSAINRSTRSAKAMGEALGDKLVSTLADALPPGVIGMVARTYAGLGLAAFHPPIFNLIVSNVKGPTFPLYVGGARLMANYPIGPMLDGAGLNITVISYLDHVDFGFATIPELVEDPWQLARAAAESFDELTKAAAERTEANDH